MLIVCFQVAVFADDNILASKPPTHNIFAKNYLYLLSLFRSAGTEGSKNVQMRFAFLIYLPNPNGGTVFHVKDTSVRQAERKAFVCPVTRRTLADRPQASPSYPPKSSLHWSQRHRQKLLSITMALQWAHQE